MNYRWKEIWNVKFVFVGACQIVPIILFAAKPKDMFDFKGADDLDIDLAYGLIVAGVGGLFPLFSILIICAKPDYIEKAEF